MGTRYRLSNIGTVILEFYLHCIIAPPILLGHIFCTLWPIFPSFYPQDILKTYLKQIKDFLSLVSIITSFCRLYPLTQILMGLHASLQIHHADSTLKRHGNDRFNVVSTWNPRGVFVRFHLQQSLPFANINPVLSAFISFQYVDHNFNKRLKFLFFLSILPRSLLK